MSKSAKQYIESICNLRLNSEERAVEVLILSHKVLKNRLAITQEDVKAKVARLSWFQRIMLRLIRLDLTKI